MDEAALQDRLRRIEHRQYLMLVLLVIPYLLGIAELIGVWIAGVLYAALGLVVFATVVVSRRRNRATAGE